MSEQWTEEKRAELRGFFGGPGLYSAPSLTATVEAMHHAAGGSAASEQIYVCVHDGDFTVWVLTEGHAWPVSDVASALVMAEHIASEAPHGYMHADGEFVALVGQEGVWWDREPIAEDGPDAAVLLGGDPR